MFEGYVPLPNHLQSWNLLFPVKDFGVWGLGKISGNHKIILVESLFILVFLCRNLLDFSVDLPDGREY